MSSSGRAEVPFQRRPLPAIVAQMEPSAEQVPAICARGRDVVVTAGAGTGKTRTLVARYLSLLEDGIPLRSVVAITFTRKAAREMRNRVRAVISEFIEGRNITAATLERWQGLYGELDAARIGTIHSLCTEILRFHPAEAGVDPRFQVLEEGRARILLNLALDEALAWAADSPEAAVWFSLAGETGLRQSLDALAIRRLDVQEALALLPEDALTHWRQQLERIQQEALDALVARPQWTQCICTLEDNQAGKSDDLAELQRQMALEAVRGVAGSLAERVGSLSALSAIRINCGSSRSWPGGAAQLGAVREALRTLRELWNEVDLSSLKLSPLDEELGRALPALKALFRFTCERYQALKRELNALDFDDLEDGALRLLREDAEVRSYWQGLVQAILVDEFQDTNGRQRDLVSLLNGRQGKLFIVGDAKQSIYRFRGADVTVFRKERDRVLAEEGKSFTLRVSYRAHAELVQAMNDLLKPVLGVAEDKRRPWVEPFSELKPYRTEAGHGFLSPHVEIHLAAGTKKGGALERAAEALAARLTGLVESGGCQVNVEGRCCVLGYGDIAILCRASTSFPAYEEALEQAGIPFLTVAGRGFYDRPEIRDVLNALQALADPTDDLALAGLLRSPAVGLSDVDLYRLCQERERRGAANPLWDVLQRGGGGLSATPAARAVRIISEVRSLVGRASVADVVKAFLDATDYRAALLRAGRSRAARNVAKLLADAHASGIVGVGAFLEYLNGLRDVGAREGEARATAEGVVQIMSVHQAKGLEFPVVVIGDVGSEGKDRETTLIDPDLGVLVPIKREDDAPATVCLVAKKRNKDKDAAESDRLLYVAATRAKEHLLLSGCAAIQGGALNLKGWLGRMCGPLGLGPAFAEIDEQGTKPVSRTLCARQTEVSCTVYGSGCAFGEKPRKDAIGIPPALAVPPPLLARVPLEPVHVDERASEQQSDPPRRVWRVVPAVERPQAPAWIIGKLVHDALGNWRFPDDGFERWAAARGRGYGLTDGRQLLDAARESRRLLQRFAAHDLFRQMDKAERRLHEVPYSIQVGSATEAGIIDALYLREGTWTLVEFKTDRVRGREELASMLSKDYRAQLCRYVAAAEGLLGQRPEVILCLLNYSSSVHVVADPL